MESRIGKYEITGILGAGGMGKVYRARDPILKRDVAIKALPEEVSRDPNRIARFQREAEVLASLNHRNIAGIYELEESGGERYLILELVEGETLAELIAKGPIPVSEALRIAVQICDAVEAAHERNVIHRDLKPANIKLTPDADVKLLDFGLAHIFETDHANTGLSATPTLMTMGNMVLGTAAYMSPEQARGKVIDKRTDIWAFGCVLFEMLTGRQAFSGETVSDTIAAILGREPDVSALHGDVPPRIVNLIRKCTQKDVRRRLHDIADARIEILESLDDPLPAAGTQQAQTSRELKRRRLFWLAVPILSLLFLFAGWGIGNLSRQPTGEWSGSLMVGGSTIAWGPRVSPDGGRVVFIVLVNKQTQVALMDAETGSWDILTKRPAPGVCLHAAWSRDGSKIFFSRGATTGVDVYSIPSVGGEERLILDDAYFPEPLPDGSLLVTRSNESGQPQLSRYWPESNSLEPLPVYLSSGLDPLVPIRAFPDGQEAVFFGRTGESTRVDPTPDVHVINLATKQTRRVSDSLGVNTALWPVSVNGNGLVLSDAPAGDLHRLVAIDRDGGAYPKALLALTDRFSGVDIRSDGTIFVDQQNNTLEVLRIDATGGAIERVARAEAYQLRSHTVELPNARVIVPTLVSGRPRLMLTGGTTQTTPLIDTAEATSGPLTVIGQDRIAFMFGSGGEKTIAIASLADGRILGKVSIPDPDSILQLAASADAEFLYYVSNNAAWEVPATGGSPRRLAPASSIAVDPRGSELIIQRVGPDLSVRLFRLLLPGETEEEIRIGSGVRMGDVPLAANAVRADGKIVLTTALDAYTWYWQVSVFDPESGSARHVPTNFAGDILYAGWTADGHILATGVNTEGSIWRFKPKGK